MLQGLASLLDECPTVLGGDYGESLAPLRKPSDYDVALHLDFADEKGYAGYVAHPTHVAVSGFNATLAVEGRTTRVDWPYDGPSRVGPRRVRHCAAFIWAAEGTPERRADALAAVGGLGAQPGVISTVAALDTGGDPRASDWILDVELEDEAAARSLLGSAAYRDAMAAVAVAVDPGRTARVTHAERGAG